MQMYCVVVCTKCMLFEIVILFLITAMCHKISDTLTLSKFTGPFLKLSTKRFISNGIPLPVLEASLNFYWVFADINGFS